MPPQGLRNARGAHCKDHKPREAEQQIRMLVNRVLHAVHAAALDQLPETASPPEAGNPPGGQETRALAKAHHKTRSRWELKLHALWRGQWTPFEAFPSRSS